MSSCFFRIFSTVFRCKLVCCSIFYSYIFVLIQWSWTLKALSKVLLRVLGYLLWTWIDYSYQNVGNSFISLIIMVIFVFNLIYDIFCYIAVAFLVSCFFYIYLVHNEFIFIESSVILNWRFNNMYNIFIGSTNI